MNTTKKTAFAICASGERYIEYRKNLVSALKKYVPGVDIIDIDPMKTGSILDGMSEFDRQRSVRLAIPIMDDFKRFDRVIWLDTDTDISSEKFASILDVETSKDGLAAAPDVNQDMYAEYMEIRFPEWSKETYFNSGVLVMDLDKIDKDEWTRRVSDGLLEHSRDPLRWADQDILNAMFDIAKIDQRYNWLWPMGVDASNGAWLVHYVNDRGHEMLDEIIQIRGTCGGEARTWKDRCVVISPRHAFIRPWIRAYFSTGNTIPLVIVPGPKGDWKDGDMEYCQAAVEFCGGIIFDCSEEWKNSERLAVRAVKKSNVGWFTKKSILHAVAKKLAPKSWAWIDDDAEVTGLLDECFDSAERSPGFIATQFYYPDSIDNRHPARTYRSNIDTGDKICWNSLVFFHGEANKRISEELGKDFPVEDDEIVFCHLYQHNSDWHEGFCDFSIRNWQKNCKKMDQIPRSWNGKLLHYTSTKNGGEMKKMWASKADRFPKAPFEERKSGQSEVACDNNHSNDDPIDAVFVIGTGSVGNNEELRYALRNIEKHCPFVRNVYICGFCPPWVDKSVVRHLQWPDRFSHAKDSNIIDKLRHACEHPGIAKRILFCSDDQFQTRVCTWEDFSPRYLRRYASNDGWYDGRKRVWHTRLRHTLERDVQRRRSIGMSANDVFYYQPHIWMPIDRDVFIDYARWCGYERRDDTIIASGYYNYANVKGVPDFDHVFITGNSTDMPKATHVAYHDGSYDAAMKILKVMFPDKCRFESSHEFSKRIGRPAKSSEIHIVQGVRNLVENTEDPSPATDEEKGEILDITTTIRNSPIWHNLLGEISRAEELRLFGVRGWRIVWKDIVSRWRETTCGGADLVPVNAKRSDEAASILNAYMQNPDSLRTVHFGSRAIMAEERTFVPGRQLPRPASLSTRESLRDRIRALR